MKQKKILIVGSGRWQLHLIKAAKAAGLYVINTNLYEDSVGFRFADVGLAVDIYDLEKHVAIGREYGIDAVVTDQIDIAVYQSGRLSNPLCFS